MRYTHVVIFTFNMRIINCNLCIIPQLYRKLMHKLLLTIYGSVQRATAVHIQLLNIIIIVIYCILLLSHKIYRAHIREIKFTSVINILIICCHVITFSKSLVIQVYTIIFLTSVIRDLLYIRHILSRRGFSYENRCNGRVE